MTVSTMTPGIWQREADGSWLLLPNGPVYVAGPPPAGAPTAPAVQVTATTTSSITIAWDAVPTATGYAVTVNGTNVWSGTALTYQATGLQAGTSYTIGVTASNTAGTSQATIIAATTTTSAPPPPVTGQSYWTSLYPVTHGVQLDPSGTKKAGIPPGTVLTAATSNIITTPGVITGKSFVGQVEVRVSGVTFQRCRFQASGWAARQACGSSQYLVFIDTAVQLSDVNLIDCELYGAASVSCHGPYYVERCYFADGNDQFRVRTTSFGMTLKECVFDGVVRLNADSHPDSVQFTNNGSGSLLATIDRCWIDCHNRDTTELGNAAIQLGGFGTGGGPDGTVTDCYFNGGNYTVNAQKVPASGHLITFRRNRFGRIFRYGPLNGTSSPCFDFDDSNVWADTLQPLGS